MSGKAQKTENLMTLQDLSEYLQIAERTVYLWAQQGKIPGFKLGSVWRFRKEEIDLWLEERKNDTPRSHAVKEAREKASHHKTEKDKE